MNRFTFLLAYRYIRGASATTTISTMVLICCAGTFIGSCALALTLFVMNGFEQATYTKLQTVHAPLIMRGFHQEALDVDKITKVLQLEFPEIIGISSSGTQYALVQAPDDTMYTPIMIRGIDAAHESQTSSLEKNIIAATPQTASLAELLHDNHILIGELYAKQAQLTLNDTLTLLIPEPTAHKRRLEFSHHQAQIVGIFKTGIDELDANAIIGDIQFLATLFPDAGTSSLHLRPAPHISEDTLMQRLRNRLGLNVFSWKELYPGILSALTLEKYMMFFVLALITLVASMSIVSLLFMMIIQKRSDIALLLSLGISHRTLTQIFILIGMCISALASILGLAAAWGIGYLLEHYKLIELPDVYYVDHLPAHISWDAILIVFVVVMILSFLASWLPTRSMRTMNIAHTLRFEG